MVKEEYQYDEEVWPTIPNEDLWIFDKLIVSKYLGHLCGPVCIPVPIPNNYIVRPCINLHGMGYGAQIIFLEKDTSHLPPGTFWQEIFEGDHLSVDYRRGKHLRTTQGWKTLNSVTRFTRWKQIDYTPSIPKIIETFIVKYPRVNIEMIGGKVIEVHLRGNPDFDDGCVECIPIWKDDIIINCPDGYVFVEAKDFDRIGFFKKY